MGWKETETRIHREREDEVVGDPFAFFGRLSAGMTSSRRRFPENFSIEY